MILLLLIALLCCQFTLAQGSILRPLVITSSYSKKPSHALGASFNASVLPRFNSNTVTVYGGSLFMLQQVKQFSAAGVLTHESGNFCFSMHYSGIPSLNKTSIVFGYGRQLGKNISTGVQFNYHSINAGEYGKLASVGFNLGMNFSLNEKLSASIAINNPATFNTSKASEKLAPYCFSMGIAFEPSEHFIVCFELIKEEDQPPDIISSLQYSFAKNLFAGFSLLTQQPLFQLSAGYRLPKGISIEVTTICHMHLGISPGLMVTYQLNRNG